MAWVGLKIETVVWIPESAYTDPLNRDEYDNESATEVALQRFAKAFPEGQEADIGKYLAQDDPPDDAAPACPLCRRTCVWSDLLPYNANTLHEPDWDVACHTCHAEMSEA